MGTVREARIVLVSEGACQLVKEAAIVSGSYSALARQFSISKTTLLRYRDARITLPESVYNRLSQMTGIHALVREIRPANWGQSKGGRISGGKSSDSLKARSVAAVKARLLKLEKLHESVGELVEALIKERTMELAEFVGRMLGDGNLPENRKPRYRAGEIENHLRMAELVEKLFSYRPQPNSYEGNCYTTNMRRITGEVLVRLGIPPGKKVVSNPHFSRFIFNTNETMIATLKGFFDDEAYVNERNNEFRVGITVEIRDPSLKDFVRFEAESRGKKYLSFGEVKSIGIAAKLPRSNILDDVSSMLYRLGFSHRLFPDSVVLNKNSVSVSWRLYFYGEENLRRLIELGLVSSWKIKKE